MISVNLAFNFGHVFRKYCNFKKNTHPERLHWFLTLKNQNFAIFGAISIIKCWSTRKCYLLVLLFTINNINLKNILMKEQLDQMLRCVHKRRGKIAVWKRSHGSNCTVPGTSRTNPCSRISTIQCRLQKKLCSYFSYFQWKSQWF